MKPQLHRLLGHRISAGNDRLAGDDRRQRGEDDERQAQRLGRKHEEGIAHRFLHAGRIVSDRIIAPWPI